MEIQQLQSLINGSWIGSVFLFGLAFKRLDQPPMLGFLLAGFLMNYLGLTGGSIPLETIADLGIILLLFTIGLKLDLKGLTNQEVWGGAAIHALMSIAFLSGLIFLGTTAGLTLCTDLDMKQSILIGFALSFSSTVFAVKFLEEKGEMNALHGRASIGILIMQDLMAVLFLTISKGDFPSVWVVCLPLALYLIRPLLKYIIDHIGHGELMPLSGFFIALVVGSGSFSIVGLKPDLGALVAGILIGTHPQANEMSKSLYAFKDLFLVAFFFQIGLTEMPQLEHFVMAFFLLAALTVKTFFYFFILTRFRLRARTSLLAALTLANYSEFGLLVTVIAAKLEWLSTDWTIVVALAMTFSFLASGPLNSKSNQIYDKLAAILRRFETKSRHPDDYKIDLGEADILIFGMGPFGAMAYTNTRNRQEGKVVAVDYDIKTVEKYKNNGCNVIWGDATDYDFWHKIDLEKIQLIMLTLTKHQVNLAAIREIKSAGYKGPITATASFEDERLELLEAGATAAYNIFSEAGAGYADHVCKTTGLICQTKFIVSGKKIPILNKQHKEFI